MGIDVEGLMSLTDDLHDQAMEQVDNALIAKRRGQVDVAKEHFREALRLEKAAIDAWDGSGELTWVLIHRSAAYLALDCGDHRQAEQLAAKALAGNPMERD